MFITWRHSWGHLFNDDPAVVKLVASILPLVALFQVVDGIGAVTGGVLRAQGKQFTGALLNLRCALSPQLSPSLSHTHRHLHTTLTARYRTKQRVGTKRRRSSSAEPPNEGQKRSRSHSPDSPQSPTSTSIRPRAETVPPTNGLDYGDEPGESLDLDWDDSETESRSAKRARLDSEDRGEGPSTSQL